MSKTLIAMAVHDTDENGRTEYTERTIEESLLTLDPWRKAWIIDNGSCEKTKKLLAKYERGGKINLITLPENIGTAKAVNLAWRHRQAGQHCVKMDNDVVIHSTTWVDELEECINCDPRIGIVGLKRKDCWENPEHPDPFYRSRLITLPHVGGQPWINVEAVNHVMGTCQLYNSALLDRIGYLYQPRLYGFDDALAAVRCKVAGFYSCFLPHIRIDHIDRGDTAYQGWKEKHAGEDMDEYNRLKNGYISGTIDIYSDYTW